MRYILVTLLFISMTALANEAKVATSEVADSMKSVASEVATTVAAEIATESTSAGNTEKSETAVSPKESEIPLNLESPKKTTEEAHPFFKVLLAISMMGVLGTGAYFFIRKYSKTNFAAGKHNQIKVLTQHYLGPKKSLAIIRVAGESILVGITDHNISMIKSLALMDDELPEATPNDFSGLIQQDTENESSSFRMDAEDDEFSIRGIKDVVSKRLKGMRSLQ